MSFIDDMRYSWAATQLASVASSSAPTIEAAYEILGGFSPAERQAIGLKAVALGAPADVVASLLALVEGEVIEVSGKAPTIKIDWLPIVLGGLAVAGVGSLAYRKYAARTRP